MTEYSEYEEALTSSELLAMFQAELRALLSSPDLSLEIRKEIEAMLNFQSECNIDVKGEDLCS